MFVIDDLVLTTILSGVVGELTSQGVQLLRGNPEKGAFKAALKEATSDVGRVYPKWTATLFDGRFLSAPVARMILARAVQRAAGPIADDLARAYANYFAVQSEQAEAASAVLPVVADFLLRLDMSMRGRPEFKQLFDSRALDLSARYLHDLLQYVNSGWMQHREDLVTAALGMYAEAAVRYEEAGQVLGNGGSIATARAQRVDGRACCPSGTGAPRAHRVLGRRAHRFIIPGIGLRPVPAG